MANDNGLVVMNGNLLAVAEPKGRNYIVTSPLTGADVKLERDVDFGVIPGTKRPSLFKSGAEKIIGAYQLMTRYTIESKIEQYDTKNVYFMYVVKCELVKGFVDGDGHYNEAVYATGYGSANTAERRNGNNDACNSANATLKMSLKRALTAAAISISGLSSMFTMDIEDTEVTKKASELIKETPDSPITKAQNNRIFALARDNGLSVEECKIKLKAMGFDKSTSITQKDYNMVIDALKNIDDTKEKKNGTKTT